MTLLIDVHCHLDHRDFEKDLDEVVRRAEFAGLKVIITAGINLETNRLSLELARRFSVVKSALGIYPIDALQNEIGAHQYPLQGNEFNIDEELDFIAKNSGKIIAVGEAGLDYESGNNKVEQKELFQKIIGLAEHVCKPLIVHSRKAEQDVVEMLESSRLKKVVMHCFSGGKSLVKRIAQKGWHFSVPTNVVRSEQFQSMVRNVDISRLLTETDAPYLSPFKGQRNEPAFVIEAVRKIAELKNMQQQEVENILFMNYEKLFL
jgi:TatD DNase family protein